MPVHIKHVVVEGTGRGTVDVGSGYVTVDGCKCACKYIAFINTAGKYNNLYTLVNCQIVKLYGT